MDMHDERTEAEAIAADAVTDISTDDPVARDAALARLVRIYRSAAGVIARERARNIAAMSADGMSYAEIAQALGITRARAQQLVGAGREAS